MTSPIDSLTLNNQIIALQTKSEYLERDIRDHKEQTEKQFEKLSGRFDKMDVKIDTIVTAVTDSNAQIAAQATEAKVNFGKIWMIGGIIGAVSLAIITAVFRWMLP